jgi:hypothetical protein
VVEHSLLPSPDTKPPLLREHRLYQADWLLRFYHFSADEILSEAAPNFNPYLDPKCNWAIHNMHLFPIEVSTADYEMLLRVPGIGPKSAQRIAYWLLNAERDQALRLADAIVQVKNSVHFCERCFNYAQDDLCEICASPSRNAATICVVSAPHDIPPIERTAVFEGTYHVLGGALSPMASASSASPASASARRISGVFRTKCALVISFRAKNVSRHRAAVSKSLFAADSDIFSSTSANTSGRFPSRNAHASSKRAR